MSRAILFQKLKYVLILDPVAVSTGISIKLIKSCCDFRYSINRYVFLNTLHSYRFMHKYVPLMIYANKRILLIPAEVQPDNLGPKVEFHDLTFVVMILLLIQLFSIHVSEVHLRIKNQEDHGD